LLHHCCAISFTSFTKTARTVVPFFSFFSQHAIDWTADSQHNGGLFSE